MDLDSLLLSGVAREDVEAYRVLSTARYGSDPGATASAGALCRAVMEVRDLWCSMPLRSALAWVLLWRWSGAADPASPAALVSRWAQVGLQDHGWLWHAAGFTVEEVHRHTGPERADPDALLALAVLRGAPLPVTGADRPVL